MWYNFHITFISSYNIVLSPAFNNPDNYPAFPFFNDVYNKEYDNGNLLN